MILVTQMLIIVAALALLIYGLGSRRTYTTRAWKKIGLSLLVVGIVVAAIFPDSTNRLAHLVGVGRGADLLIYILTLAFITYTLNSYLREQDDKDALHRLARKIAIVEAQNRYK